ncbi:hypothetical protein GCM10027089_19230 [Nocardia thraciensis]
MDGDSRAYPFENDSLHDDYALDSVDTDANLVAGLDLMCGFDRDAVDADMPTPTGGSGRRAGLEQTHGPHPGIDPGRTGL